MKENGLITVVLHLSTTLWGEPCNTVSPIYILIWHFFNGEGNNLSIKNVEICMITPTHNKADNFNLEAATMLYISLVRDIWVLNFWCGETQAGGGKFQGTLYEILAHEMTTINLCTKK